jgi:hypothetical protein
MVMTDIDTAESVTSAPVNYGKVVRVTSLQRDTHYAQKRWIEWQKARNSNGVGFSAKWVVSKVLFLGASWHGIGQWLKDGELPMLKASDGLGYYFQVDDKIVVAHVDERCLFLQGHRLTFSVLLEAPAAEEVIEEVVEELEVA